MGPLGRINQMHQKVKIQTFQNLSLILQEVQIPVLSKLMDKNFVH